jgi:hypothetical protein
MSYLYTQLNRLDEPHNYMYTPFGGEAFLQAYRTDRQAAICRIAEAVNTHGDDVYDAAVQAFLQSAGWDGERLSSPSKPSVLVVSSGGNANAELSQLSLAAAVDTECLLEALLATQLDRAKDRLIKEWLDRLVQRFEVTKKLYATYPPGFRKGEGANTSVRLYWLLALSLCLFYAETRNLKYLSALLKVNDLLASLPQEILLCHFSTKLMTVVFQVELAAVAGLTATEEGEHVAQ